MVTEGMDIESDDGRWRSLYRVSGLAALLAGLLFLAALADLVLAGLAGTASGWLSLVADNWLVVLYKLNAGYNGVSYDQLNRLNPLDIIILALVGTMYLGLYAVLRTTNKTWSLIAAVLPFLGIVLLVATGIAGRSAVMGAGLIISLVMLRSNIFGRVVACVGLGASVLLLVGDIGTTPGAPSSIFALSIGMGYVLLTAWFFLISQRLVQLGQAHTSHLGEQGAGEGRVRPF